MAEKLKTYFRNCYLITGRAAYLDMVSQVGRHADKHHPRLCPELIGKLGTAFGYGANRALSQATIIGGERSRTCWTPIFCKRKRPAAGILPRSWGCRVYAIRESILDFIGKLHSKTWISVPSGPAISAPFPPRRSPCRAARAAGRRHSRGERACADQLRENNQIHLGSIMSVINRFMSAPRKQGPHPGFKGGGNGPAVSLCGRISGHGRHPDRNPADPGGAAGLPAFPGGRRQAVHLPVPGRKGKGLLIGWESKRIPGNGWNTPCRRITARTGRCCSSLRAPSPPGETGRSRCFSTEPRGTAL